MKDDHVDQLALSLSDMTAFYFQKLVDFVMT